MPLITIVTPIPVVENVLIVKISNTTKGTSLATSHQFPLLHLNAKVLEVVLQASAEYETW